MSELRCQALDGRKDKFFATKLTDSVGTPGHTAAASDGATLLGATADFKSLDFDDEQLETDRITHIRKLIGRSTRNVMKNLSNT